MQSVLGPYYDPWHWRKEDIDFIRALDPAWVLIHQPSARAIYLVQQAAPNANIMLRSWDIDDHNNERKNEMYANPISAARKHMAMWDNKLAELKSELRTNGWAYDESKWYLQGPNEPDPAHVPQVVEWSLEAMGIATHLGWHLGLIVSSVGTFKKPSEGDDGWALCKPLEQPINDGGHIVIAHEYWEPKGPNHGEDGGNLAWRHRIIPLNVPILIGEAGANGYIESRYSQNDDSGWGKHMNAATFAGQVKEYIEGCDTRVKGVLLYMLDYHDDQWRSFDIHDAISELLAIKDTRPKVPSPFSIPPPNVIHLPGVFNGKPESRFEMGDLVRTTTTVNARHSPGTQGKSVDDVLVALRPNTPVELLEGPQHAGGLVWWRTTRGWVAEVAPNGMALLTTGVNVPVELDPLPIPSGAINPQLAEAVLQVESRDNFFSEGNLVIRLELHLFRKYLDDNALFDTYFYHDPQQGHLDQRWRRSPRNAWQESHLGSNDFAANQRHEWAVLSFAATLDRHAALMATSMGAPQVMGFNHARIGYPSPEAMLNAFQRSASVQIVGFFNYCITDLALFAALRNGDWAEIARRYNGDSNQVQTYVSLMKDAYQKILGA